MIFTLTINICLSCCYLHCWRNIIKEPEHGSPVPDLPGATHVSASLPYLLPRCCCLSYLVSGLRVAQRVLEGEEGTMVIYMTLTLGSAPAACCTTET